MRFSVCDTDDIRCLPVLVQYLRIIVIKQIFYRIMEVIGDWGTIRQIIISLIVLITGNRMPRRIISSDDTPLIFRQFCNGIVGITPHIIPVLRILNQKLIHKVIGFSHIGMTALVCMLRGIRHQTVCTHIPEHCLASHSSVSTDDRICKCIFTTDNQIQCCIGVLLRIGNLRSRCLTGNGSFADKFLTAHSYRRKVIDHIRILSIRCPCLIHSDRRQGSVSKNIQAAADIQCTA